MCQDFNIPSPNESFAFGAKQKVLNHASFDSTTWQRLREPMFENKAKAIVNLLRCLLSHKF
jgi:hypothetical protein